MTIAAVTPIHGARVPSDDEMWAVWELEMRAASCTERTIKERRIIFRALANFLGKPILSATRTDLITWLARPSLSPKTRQNYKSYVHTLFTLAQDEGLRADNPAARLPRGRSPRFEPNPFTTEEVQQLLDSGIYARTRMMVLLAAYQGFRAVEIAATSGRHIDWDTRRILTVEAKGGVEVWRPLHPAVYEFAIAHPKRFPRDDWWFPGIGPNAGEHINAKSVSNNLKKALNRAGINHRPHQLRAWFATQLLEQGADMLTIQHAMRHASPNTLRHYIAPPQTLIRDGMERLPELRAPATTARASGRAS